MADDAEDTTPKVLIEVQRGGGQGDQLGRGSQLTGAGPIRIDFSEKADELGSAINEIALALEKRFTALSRKDPEGWDLNEVSVAFSISVQAEGGFLIAKASAGAAFEASLKWVRGRE